MIVEFECKHCGYTLLLDPVAIKDYVLQCPGCNTRFIGVIVDSSTYLKDPDTWYLPEEEVK